MNLKKLLPFALLAVLLVAALVLRRCNTTSKNELTDNEKQKRIERNDDKPDEEKTDNEKSSLDVFRDTEAKYFFTKHARCRMKCRHISQEEVKEIVQRADVNYKKSELDAPEGPKYALEGVTSGDKQHVRIIVAPKKRHLTIVTVIDLENEWNCPSCK
jgi:Domain of unknown function (DUF4258)